MAHLTKSLIFIFELFPALFMSLNYYYHRNHNQILKNINQYEDRKQTKID